MTTDTVGRMARSCAEVIPTHLATVFDDLPRRQDTRYGNKLLHAVDIWSGMGEVTQALGASGFSVCAAVESDPLYRPALLTNDAATLAYSDLELLTAAVRAGKVELPLVSLVVAKIAHGSVHGSVHAKNADPYTSPRSPVAQELRFAQTIVAVQGASAMTAVVLLCASHRATRMVYENRDLISEMGLSCSTVPLQSTRHGDTVNVVFHATVLLREPAQFEMLQPIDCFDDVATVMETNQHRSLVKHMLKPAIVSYTNEDSIYFMPALRVIDAEGGTQYRGVNYFSAHGPMPRVTEDLPFIVDDANDDPTTWSGRQGQRWRKRTRCTPMPSSWLPS